MVSGATHQPPEGLFQPQPGNAVIIGGAAKGFLAGAVQYGRAWPRNSVEHYEAQSAARHIDTIADRIGAENAAVFFGAEDLDQAGGVHAIDMLCQ